MIGERRTDRTRVYWVDKLSILSVVKLATLTLWKSRTGVQSVRYLSATPGGTRLFRALARLATVLGVKLTVQHEDYDLYDLRSTHEEHTTFGIDLQVDEMQERVGQAVVADLDVDALLTRCLGRPYSERKFRLYLVQAIANEVYDDVLSLSVMQGLVSTARDDIGDSPTLLIKRSIFSSYILNEHPASKALRVESYVSLGETRLVLRVAGGFTRQFLLALVALGRGLPARITGPMRAQASSALQRPRIAVQYTKGVDLDRASDIFWYPDSGLRQDQVLVYFNRSRFPSSPAAISQLERLGLPWTISSKWRPGRRDYRYLADMQQVLSAALRLAWAAIIRRPALGWLQWRVAVELEHRVSYSSAFLREHNVAVHIHSVANTHISIPLVFAAERVGGIDFAYQWSGTEWIRSVKARITASHVFFAWGPEFVEQMRRNGLAPDVYLIGGHVFAHLGRGTTERPAQIRQQMLNGSCEYIICLFDGSFSVKGSQQPPKLMADFYVTVLGWVLNNQKLGLVIKPKSAAFELLPGVKSLVDDAIARGQCVVEDPKTPSFEAALSADIAVGVGVNTAVMEAALAGVRGVHFDLPGVAKAYPGVEDGLGPLVFRDGAELYEAIEADRESGGTTGLGDHGSWLRSVDPFQDGGAAGRMGNYLRWYLESIEAGHDSQRWVADATERYSGVAGGQHVIYGHEEHAKDTMAG